MKELIPALHKIGLSGLGIKLNRYIHEIPSYMQMLGDQLEFPIVVLPAETNFSNQINEFLKEKLNRNNVELQYRNDIHMKLMDIMLLGGEYQGLSKSLSETVEKNVTLLNVEGETLAEYLPCAVVHNNLVFQQWFDRMEQSDFYCHGSVEGKDGGVFTVYAVKFFNEITGYMVISSQEEFCLSPLEQIAVEQFAIAYNIINQKQRAISQMETKYFDEFACELLFRKIENNRAAIERAKTLGWKLNFPIAILLIDIQGHAQPAVEHTSYLCSADGLDRSVVINHLKKKYSQVFTGKLYEHGCCFANTGKYIAAFLDAHVFQEYLRLSEMIERILAERGIEDFYIGISRLQARIENMEKSYFEAEKTLEIARMIGGKKTLHFKEIGIYRIIQAAKSKEDLREFCMDTIGVLIEYDKQHSTNLIETIDTIIQNSGNLKVSASKLFIHYNTIRYRYALIQQLLDKNFDDCGFLQDINLAVKIYYTCYP